MAKAADTTIRVVAMTNQPSALTDILTAHQRNEWGQHDGWWECICGEPYSPAHQAAAVAAAGIAAIPLPTVAFKGPYDTDASMFRHAADRAETCYPIGGSNRGAIAVADAWVNYKSDAELTKATWVE